MLTRQELEKNPLFQDITYESYLQMLTCFQAVQKSYRPDEVLYDFTDPRSNSVGILERGTAALIRIDEEGVTTVLEELGPGGVFGRSLAFSGSRRDSLEVVARTPCDVAYIDYPHILRRCENACAHHSQLVHNVLGLLTEQNLRLSRRVEVLSRRSIREKLLCYFTLQTGPAGGTFTLPFTLSALADYISTDRSAMMRELRKMREEGLVTLRGRQVTLAG